MNAFYHYLYFNLGAIFSIYNTYVGDVSHLFDGFLFVFQRLRKGKLQKKSPDPAIDKWLPYISESPV